MTEPTAEDAPRRLFLLDGHRRQGQVFRYERWVDEPRLTAGGSAKAPPHPVFVDAQRALQHRYGVRFDGFGMSRYRNGRDLMAFHRDRVYIRHDGD